MCASDDDKKHDSLSLAHLAPLQRRTFLAKLGVLGLSMIAISCNSNSFTSSDGTTSGDTNDGGTSSGSCSEAPSETNGPYPADGTNTAGDGTSTKLDKVYTGSPIVRSSIAEGMSGVPLLLNINLQNVNGSCAALEGYFIYVWHCTAAGIYSAYAQGGTSHSSSENYMRGIQETDSSGNVSFTTIYPGWYTGRAIHIHVEIYRSLDDASPVKITQLAFPMSTNNAVAALTSYGYKGVSGMTTNSSDGIFADSITSEMLTVTGNTSGYVASINLGVKA